MTGAEMLDRILLSVPPRFRKHALTLSIPEGSFGALDAGNSIFLHGEVGSGKTTLGLAIACQWLKSKIETREAEGRDLEQAEGKLRAGEMFIFETYLDMMFKIRGSYEDGKAEQQRNKWRKGRLYFLDDLFSGRATDNANEEIFGVMNYRYSNFLPSIVTSNKSPDDVGAIEDRIASRLFGDGSLLIHVRGDDRRALQVKTGVVNAA